ncbi:hypothetical protein [Microbispora sp. KK1-11]
MFRGAVLIGAVLIGAVLIGAVLIELGELTGRSRASSRRSRACAGG